jgi:hypothetical protein
MSSAPATRASTPNITMPRTEYDALQEQVQSLQGQLDWFKRQLFGRKSEKRLIDNPDQLGLAEVLGEMPVTALVIIPKTSCHQK